MNQAQIRAAKFEAERFLRAVDALLNRREAEAVAHRKAGEGRG